MKENEIIMINKDIELTKADIYALLINALNMDFLLAKDTKFIKKDDGSVYYKPADLPDKEENWTMMTDSQRELIGIIEVIGKVIFKDEWPSKNIKDTIDK